jgi:NAD(P)-dependent dehydrogenase (short-subunit alcohol dehydrogenase family)
MTDARAIVVGGAGGIGSDVARVLAAHGYRVSIADLDAERAQHALEGLEGTDHQAVSIDVTAQETIEAGFAEVERLEPASLLVIASGGPVVHLGEGATLATMKLVDWEKTLAINLTGVFSCIQAFTRLRQENAFDQGRIVIIGSAAGLVAGSGTDVAYSVSKSALFGLARQAAFELAPSNITVNVIAPGPVATPEFFRKTNEQIRAGIAAQSLLKRIAKPEEVSAAVLYLLSPQAAFITGTTIDLNGGLYLR